MSRPPAASAMTVDWGLGSRLLATRGRYSRRYAYVFFACILVGLLYLQFGILNQYGPSSTSRPYVRPEPPSDRFDWASRRENFPVRPIHRLPSGTGSTIPRIQATFGAEDPYTKEKRLSRQRAVKESFMHSWKGYKEHAWLKDEVHPVNGGFGKSFGWATTLVDSLDTLWIMNETKEFEDAIWDLRRSVDLTSIDAEVRSVFETTIRHIGGLLAAYDVSGARHPILLDMAVEMGDMFYAAFDTPNRMPINWWNWNMARKNQPQSAATSSLLAELGSLSLEFTRLSQLTQDPKFYDAVQRVTDVLEASQDRTRLPGMWPVMNDAANLLFRDNRFTLGSMADSTYEYLPKQHLLVGGATKQSRKMYEKAIEVSKKHIFYRPMLPEQNDILFSGNAKVNMETDEVRNDGEVQHLACFTGGMVAMAAKIFDRPQDLDTARKLVDGCVWAYEHTPTGIMPEIFHVVPCNDTSACPWDRGVWSAENGGRAVPPGVTQYDDKRYLLRPEAIESVFIYYRITGNTAYQDAAWTMFQAIEKHTRTAIASSAVTDVTVPKPAKLDQMESFWLGETLKYFYLIFSEPDLISLDDYVLNTEAHPFRRP